MINNIKGRFIYTPFLLLLLSACAPWWNVEDTYDPSFDIPSTGATTPQGVCWWVDARVEYLDDEIHDQLEYWQSPDQTYEWRRGDCEDYVLLVMYLIHRDLGGWPELILGYYDDGAGRLGHAWIAYGGRWYEAQTGQDITTNPAYALRETVNYGIAMWRAMNTHQNIAGERRKQYEQY